jgi:uncharacterized protein
VRWAARPSLVEPVRASVDLEIVAGESGPWPCRMVCISARLQACRRLEISGVTMKLRCLSVIPLLLVAFTRLLAQSDTPATREDVLKLFDTMKLHDQMKLVMDTVVKQQRTMMRENLKKRVPQFTEEELSRMDQFTKDVVKDMPVDGLLDDMIPVYQKHLSRSNVDAMNTFYASPTGQKLLREMPSMTAEAMQAAGPRMQSMMEKVMDRAEQMATEEREKQHRPTPATNKN